LLLKNASASTPDQSCTEDLDLRHADGSEVSYEMVITFIRDDAGNPTGVLGVSRDITERKKLTQKLADTQRRESLGILAGGIAHDFNNLIGVILGHADLIAHKLDDNDPLQTSLAKIKQGADSAAQMCTQMLSFSGNGGTITERIRLSTRVRELLNLIRSSLPDKALVEYHLAPDLSDVLADPSDNNNMRMDMMGFNIIKEPFSFHFSGLEGETVPYIDTKDASLVFSDKYIQMDFTIPSWNVYGFGERIHDTELSQGAWNMWGKNKQSVMDDGTGSGVQSTGMHPFILFKNKKAGDFGGMFFRNSNGQAPILRFK